MKWRNYLYGVCCLALFASCYDEDALTVDEGGEDLVRFEFPQGTNPWDETIVAIQQKFNVFLIYKDIQASDLNRAWTGGVAGQQYGGEGLIDEAQAEFMVDFMQNHVFAYLTPQITQKVLPMYYYLVYDCHASVVFGPFNLKAPVKTSFEGMDYWSLCMFYGESDPMSDMFYGRIEVPETPTDFLMWRGNILLKILRIAYDKGNIVMPEEFQNGFDYKTEIVSGYGMEDDPNYYVKRGFPGQSVSFPSLHVLQRITNTNPSDNFFAYIHLGMRYTSEALEDLYPKAKYPFLWEKRQYVLDYMKNKYELDLEAMAEGPEI